MHERLYSLQLGILLGKACNGVGTVANRSAFIIHLYKSAIFKKVYRTDFHINDFDTQPFLQVSNHFITLFGLD